MENIVENKEETITSNVIDITKSLLDDQQGPPEGFYRIDNENSDDDYSYDCWKPILHEESTEPSKGKYLRDIATDPRIKQITVNMKEGSEIPEVVLENIWNEKFRMEFVVLSNGQLAAHAIKLE